MTNYYTFSRDEMTDVVSTASAAIKEACGWGGGDPAFLYTNGGNDSGSCQKGAYYTSLVGTSVSWDMRNHPKNPTKGLFFQVAGDFAGLGGDVQYVRLSAEGRAYYPLTDKITFVGRAIGGDIEGWGGQDVRLLDLFFKGGETVRGFNRSGYGPRDLITSDALGGSRFWAATAEVRFPLPLIPDDLGISGAVFADAGSLWGAGAGAKRLATDGKVVLVDDSSVRSSAGASILWNSPVGPLRIDFAKAITKQDYDKEQFVRFGAQTKF
jgi:outer membrane protein insertion porin family